MPFTANLTIAGAARGTLDAALTYFNRSQAARRPETAAYIRELKRLCDVANIDFAVAFAQWAVETGVGTSNLWATRLNPAGIGALETLENPGVIDYVGLTYATGEQAARAHVVHLFVYVHGPIPADHELHGYIELDPRYNAVIQAGYAGKATSITYLATRWAADREYDGKIVFRLNDCFGEPLKGDDTNTSPPTPNPVYVLGRIPRPTILQRFITNNTAWDDLGVRRPFVGFVFHTMEGTLWGTDSWFRGGGARTALTDFGIGNGGEIIQWVDLAGRRSPHASGPANGVEGDGQAFINTYGINGINRRLISIELEGYFNSPIPNEDWAALVHLTAYLAETELGLTAEEWWFLYGLTVVFGHYEFATKVCPGSRLINRWNEFVIAVRDFMAFYQLDAGGTVPDPTPTYAPVSPVEGFDGSADVTFNNVVFHADKQRVTASAAGGVHQYASSTSAPTRAPLAVGEQFQVHGWVEGQEIDGEKRWWITATHSRVWVGYTTEKPTVVAPPVEEPDGPDVVVVDGVRFYEMGADGNGRPVVLTAAANFRKYADTSSAVIGTGQAGARVLAAYWVQGQSVDGESVWYVLNDLDGPRLWGGATDTRPY